MVLKKLDPRAYMAAPWAIYYQNIQTSSSLKPLGQLKPNFINVIKLLTAKTTLFEPRHEKTGF